MTGASAAFVKGAASDARLSQKPVASRNRPVVDDTSDDWTNAQWPMAVQDGHAAFAGSSLFAWVPLPHPNMTAAAYPVATGSATLTQVLYLQETGDTAAISVNDIHQGQIDDCYLLSSIGELALFHPSWITQMIRVNADAPKR